MEEEDADAEMMEGTVSMLMAEDGGNSTPTRFLCIQHLPAGTTVFSDRDVEFSFESKENFSEVEVYASKSWQLELITGSDSAATIPMHVNVPAANSTTRAQLFSVLLEVVQELLSITTTEQEPQQHMKALDTMVKQVVPPAASINANSGQNYRTRTQSKSQPVSLYPQPYIGRWDEFGIERDGKLVAKG
ncbi:hypothetical protein C8R44DRAFT_729724 [Mycena epipterygia]|nr:hypothetical protein C8R44DRAFT_729724 [Mycena epipterygia]